MGASQDKKGTAQSEILENDKMQPHHAVDEIPTDAPPEYRANPANVDAKQNVIGETDQKASPTQSEDSCKEPTSSSTTSDQTKRYHDLVKTTAEATICQFGPGVSFFFYGGEVRANWNYLYTESECPRNVSGESVKKWMMRQPHCVALSLHGAGYFAYTSATEGIVWRFIDIPLSLRPKRRKAGKRFDEIVSAYARLKAWLSEHVINSNDIKTTQVAFGREGRYFAWKSDGVCISNDLPASYEKELQSRRTKEGKDEAPRHVTFGEGNAWAAIWKDASHSVYLDKKYEILAAFLATPKASKLASITLSHCGTGEYFVQVPLQRAHRTTAVRRKVLEDNWLHKHRVWSQQLNTSLSFVCNEVDGTVRRTIRPQDLANYEANKPTAAVKRAEEAVEEATKRALAEVDAAFESKGYSKKSSSSASTSFVVGAGVGALAAGCSIM